MALLRSGLGGVDKFKPVFGGGEMDHAEEAAGQLVIAGGDGSVDLELAEHTLDAVALLVERPVVVVFTRRFDRPGMTASMFRALRSARIASAS